MKDIPILKQIMNTDKHKKYYLIFIMNFRGMLKNGIKELNLR